VDFWFIVAVRSEDETEIRTGQSARRISAEGHSAPDASAVIGGGEDRIVLVGLRGEENISELCRREGITASMYYGWSKAFLERVSAGWRATRRELQRLARQSREATALKEVVADLTLENHLLKKKHEQGWGGRGMRYPASEKAEIIKLVEQSHLPAKRTLDKLGIGPRQRHRRASTKALSDNGASYVAGDLADWLEDKGMRHLRGAPYHPQIQGKIERLHQTLKNHILLENYYLPGDLDRQIGAFV
jgi:transposase InsO family protein